MTRLHIEHIALTLHGVSADVAQSATVGLDAEILRRLQVHGMDPARLSDLSSTLRLPAIHSPVPLDADALRRHLAEGLMAVLMPATTQEESV